MNNNKKKTLPIRWLEHALFVILSTMVVVVFANVIARFVFSSALTWADEIAGFLFVWLTFLGSIVAMAQGAHVGMDLVAQLISPAKQRWLTLISDGLVLVFLTCWGFFGWSLVTENLNYLAPSTGIPVGYVYIVGPVSAIAMALLTLGAIRRGIKGEVPSQEV